MSAAAAIARFRIQPVATALVLALCTGAQAQPEKPASWPSPEARAANPAPDSTHPTHAHAERKPDTPDLMVDDSILDDDPGDLGQPPTEFNQQLRTDKEASKNWLHLTPQNDPFEPVARWTRELHDKTGLTLGSAYTMLLQQASGGPGERTAAAGDLDVLLSWKKQLSEKDYMRLNSSFEYRFQIGSITPAQLGPEIGTLVPTTNGFNERPPVVKELYYEQAAFEGRLRFLAGRLDPENYVGGHRLQSANTFFLNKAFSSNPAIAFPSIGLGAGAAVLPVQWMYVSAGVADVNANIKRTGFDTAFDTGEVFAFTEVGFLNSIDGLGSGRQRLSLWHTDASSVRNRPADEGICFTADQELGQHVAVFARGAYANGTLTNIRQLYECGFGFKGLTGVENDFSGAAIAWASPPNGRAETIAEIFHRFQVGLRSELTFGAQLIVHPGNAPTVGALGVYECRFRMTF